MHHQECNLEKIPEWLTLTSLDPFPIDTIIEGMYKLLFWNLVMWAPSKKVLESGPIVIKGLIMVLEDGVDLFEPH